MAPGPAVFAASWDDGEGLSAPAVVEQWRRASGLHLARSGYGHSGGRVHGFAALDTVAHVLTAATVLDPSSIHIVVPESVPNPNWLRLGIPGAGQQAFGDTLLARHPFVLIPSAVSTHSWNLIFVASLAAGIYAPRLQEPFALDARLHPPVPRRSL